MNVEWRGGMNGCVVLCDAWMDGADARLVNQTFLKGISISLGEKI
jgi:hypothetical protein